MAKCTICGEVGHTRRQDINCARKLRMKSNPPNPELESEGKSEQSDLLDFWFIWK